MKKVLHIPSTTKFTQDNNNFCPAFGFSFNPHFGDRGPLHGAAVILSVTLATGTNFLNTGLVSGGNRSFRVGGKILF